MKNLQWILFVAALSFLWGCSTEERRDLPDVSGISVKLELKRFEQDLFALDTNNLAPGLAALEEDYGEFADIFFNVLLKSRDPKVAPQGHVAYVRGFLTHPAVRKLYDTTQIIYRQFPANLRRDFEMAFRYYRHYFPQNNTPRLVTFVSEYSIGNFIYGNNELAIGLDFFLGPQYPYLRYNPGNDNFSAYLARSFSPEHLVAKTLLPLVDDLVGEPGGDQLLDWMIHNGKKLYLLDHLLPATPDSVKLELPQRQVQWLADNELEMWAFFIQEKMLYDSEWQKIRKYVEYSPNSPGMPTAAPGRTANYVGWQIIKAYMKRYPATTMPELIALRNAQELLKKSRYKPR